MNLEGKEFGPYNPFIAAEVSCNHNGRRENAHLLVEAAVKAGADGVKFQAFRPEQMAPKNGPQLASGPWAGATLYELYERAQTPLEWLPELFADARERGLVPFTSVFDSDDVAWIEQHCWPDVYKIASAEAGWGLLKATLAGTGKWVFVSDGAYAPEEASKGLPRSRRVAMRCVAEYPAQARDYGFGGVAWHWGLSDHSRNVGVWCAAAALGASVIEAHLRLPREYYKSEPLDAAFSLTPDSFEWLANAARVAATVAKNDREPPKETSFVRRWRWAESYDAGEIIGGRSMVALRGAEGIVVDSAEDELVGRRTARPVFKGEAVRQEDLH